jgi:hypothetical protein
MMKSARFYLKRFLQRFPCTLDLRFFFEILRFLFSFLRRSQKQPKMEVGEAALNPGPGGPEGDTVTAE